MQSDFKEKVLNMKTGKVLHITNGDCCADALKASSLRGDVLPWRDVLHEGPVPCGLSQKDLSKVRSQFIADYFQADYDETLRSFTERDLHLASSDQYDEIILWFEHDLYDQLQLLQILSWFACAIHAHKKLDIICVDQFPGVEPFYGLGQLSPPQLESLYGLKAPVTAKHLSLAQEGWKAFMSSDPSVLLSFAEKGTALLPFLKAALYRFFEEYPSIESGLGSTQQQILSLIHEGINVPGDMFKAYQQAEEAAFMGDWSFFNLIKELVTSDKPAIVAEEPSPSGDKFRFQSLGLTDFGKDLIANNADWVLQNGIDKWFGGVHLLGSTNQYRWDVDCRGFRL